MDGAAAREGSRLRIGLVVDSSLNVDGGVQEYTRGLYDYLAGSGHDVSIITCGAPGAADRGRNVAVLGISRQWPLPGSSASVPMHFWRPGAIRGFFEENDFDILHFQELSQLFCRRLLLQSRSANILTFQVYKEGFLVWTATPFLPFWRSQSPRFAARIAQSRVSLPLARTFFPGEWILLPAGVDAKRFDSEGERMSRFIDGKVNLLFVGRLDPRKGILDLLRALPLVSASRPFRLIVAGDGPDRRRAERLARSGNFPEVVFLGRVADGDLPALYRTADIFCAPTRGGECLGLVLLEAMASGLPIAACANPAYVEVLGGTPGRDFLSTPGDTAGLARNITRLAGDRETRLSLGRAMRAAAGPYDWARVGPKFVEIYRRALERSRL